MDQNEPINPPLRPDVVQMSIAFLICLLLGALAISSVQMFWQDVFRWRYQMGPWTFGSLVALWAAGAGFLITKAGGFWSVQPLPTRIFEFFQVVAVLILVLVSLPKGNLDMEVLRWVLVSMNVLVLTLYVALFGFSICLKQPISWFSIAGFLVALVGMLRTALPSWT